MLESLTINHVILAGLATLNVKIVWDWLSTRRSNGNVVTTPEVLKPHCEEHPTCVTSIADLGTSAAVNESEHEEIDRRLNQGDKKFDTMAKDIGKIKTGVDVIVAVIEERNGGPLLQR